MKLQLPRLLYSCLFVVAALTLHAQSDAAQPDSSDKVYIMVQYQPRFPGCEDMGGTPEEKDACSRALLQKFLYATIKSSIQSDTIGSGSCIVQFVVRKNGDITDVKCPRKLGNAPCEEAVRAIESMNSLDEKWIPGTIGNEPVSASYTLPLKF